MKNPTIWCVIPFSRPHQLTWVKDLLSAQTYQNKKVLVVENGPAIGACKKAGFVPDVLLASKPHQSYAKNEALLYLKNNGFGDDIWTTWDDDDYYAPEYLSELADATDKGDIIGKASSFMKLTDGKLYCVTKWKENELADEPFVHGPTVSGRVKDSLLFTYMDWGEDLVWVREMAALGAKVYRTSRYNWCYFRYANTKHTWLISDDEIMYGNAWHTHLMSDAFDADIVSHKKYVEGSRIALDEFDSETSYTFNQVKRDTGDMINKALWRAAQKMKKLPNKEVWPVIDEMKYKIKNSHEIEYSIGHR